MNDVNPYAAPVSQVSHADQQPDRGPEGLGGWLILVALGVVLSPIRILLFVRQTFVPLFTDGTWGMLTDPGSDVYNPFWGPILVFEIAGNVFFVVAYVYLGYLLFSKSRLFPKVYIALAIMNLAFMIVDSVGVTMCIPEIPLFDPDSTREIVRGIFSCAIWIPYMLVSKRVKNTFVR